MLRREILFKEGNSIESFSDARRLLANEIDIKAKLWGDGGKQKESLQQLFNDFKHSDLIGELANKFEKICEQASRRTRWDYSLDTLLAVLGEYTSAIQVDFCPTVRALQIAHLMDANCYVVTDKFNDNTSTSVMTYWAKIMLPREGSMLNEKPYAAIHTSISSRSIRAIVKELLGEWPENWSIMH